MQKTVFPGRRSERERLSRAFFEKAPEKPFPSRIGGTPQREKLADMGTDARAAELKAEFEKQLTGRVFP
jgi:hypothetical protein